jgi:hypothetical protein
MSGLSAKVVQVQRVEFENVGRISLVLPRDVAPTSNISSRADGTDGPGGHCRSDVQLNLSWTITDSLSETEIYRDGVLVYTAPLGVSSWANGGLTRATTYSYKLKHIKFSLVRSAFTLAVTGRPPSSTSSLVNATKTTPGDGYEYLTSPERFASPGRPWPDRLGHRRRRRRRRWRRRERVGRRAAVAPAAVAGSRSRLTTRNR